MAIARTHGATLVGVHGHVVQIEADLADGLPGLVFTGLPDTAGEKTISPTLVTRPP